LLAVPLLEVTTEAVEDARVLRVRGEVDLCSVDDLRAHLELAERDGVPTHLDLSAVTFMDSSGLHLLVDSWKRARVEGWQLAIVHPSPQVLRLLQVTCLDEVLPLVLDDGPHASETANAL
jgi:anti-anti-sigma factor